MYVAIAEPRAPHEMPYRACVRHERGPLRPSTPRTLSAGTRTSSKASCDVTEARRDIFIRCSGAEKPFIPFSTRKPRTGPFLSPTFAQTTATSAIEPFVIQALAPFRIQSLPSFFATVRMPPGFEPKSGSVRPKQPIFSPFESAELLRDEPVGDVVQARQAVLRNRGPEEVHRGHLRDQLLREPPLVGALFDDRKNVLVHEAAHEVAHGPLVLGKHVFDPQEIDSGKAHGNLQPKIRNRILLRIRMKIEDFLRR